MLTSRVATLQDNSAHGEDNYLIRALGEHAFLDAIMDGVTGRGGKQASRLAVEALAVARLTSAGDMVAVLEKLNRQLYDRGGGSLLLTTVSAALCIDDKLSIAGVGDSSAFLIRSKSFQYLCSPRPGMFLGSHVQLQGFYRMEMTIEPGDRMVLATDGITDNITSSELVDVIRHSASPDEAAGQLRTIMVTRAAGECLAAAPLRGRFRYDDWTAIVRFFNALGQEGPAKNPGGTDIKVR
ncbi:MAG TPA: SpoIIE family protein phosphatase [Candidatus Tectomicrobia bacterium]